MSKLRVVILVIFSISFVNCGIINNVIDQYTIMKKGELVCNIPDGLAKEIRSYESVVNKIIDEITNGKFKGKTWDGLEKLVDSFGPRMSCTEALDKATDYAVDSMKKSGFENVHTDDVVAPKWIRGYEKAGLVLPWKHDLPILGLGSTVGTPRGGIIADVIAYESFEEFEPIPAEQVQGKIVVFVPKWEGYGKTVLYRSNAASVAARKGAVAALIRSVTPSNSTSPHTGHQNYADDVKKIPVAALTVEDAEMILRMYRNGQKVQINLEMADHNADNCTTRNVIGELVGTKFTNTSVVVVSGHLDSWDVGVGAMDDGGGAMISWKAVEFLREMGLRPKRTIRSILWTSEEQGIIGAQSYMEKHRATEKSEFNFFMESDIGTFDPEGLDFSGNDDASCVLQEVLK